MNDLPVNDLPVTMSVLTTPDCKLIAATFGYSTLTYSESSVLAISLMQYADIPGPTVYTIAVLIVTIVACFSAPGSLRIAYVTKKVPMMLISKSFY